MTPLTSIQTAVLYLNICRFISDFRPVVNFNYAYISSPKFVQSRKVLLFGRLFTPLAHQSFRSFWSFPTNIWDLFMRQPV